MTRRSFLAAAASAFTLDPDRALWTPGAKTISVAAPTRRELLMPDYMFYPYVAGGLYYSCTRGHGLFSPNLSLAEIYHLPPQLKST